MNIQVAKKETWADTEVLSEHLFYLSKLSFPSDWILYVYNYHELAL